MSDATDSQKMTRFIGINNVDDATRSTPIIVNHEYAYPLQQANNVEIDNSYAISSRSGYNDVLTGTDIHSLWSDGTICLYVDTKTLYRLTDLYASVSLRTGLTTGARMSYAPVNDRIYYSNYYEIGYIKNYESTLLSGPALSFKLPMPAGQLIEYYRGRLYVARDSILYISDPLCDYFDTRSGYKQFASRITLLRAVDKGMFVSDRKVWWMPGDAPEEFERIEAYPSPAIIHTDVQTNGQFVGNGLNGNIALWTSENGICAGANDGSVVNFTEARYTFTASGRGAAFIKENNNIKHYVNSLY